MAERYDEGLKLAHDYRDMFGRENFFLEVQDHGLDQDRVVIPHLNRMSMETGIPLVATNDSHYLRKQDARAHEILMCIQTGKTMSDANRMRFTQPEFYLKSRAGNDGALRRDGRRREPALGDRAALPGEARKG